MESPRPSANLPAMPDWCNELMNKTPVPDHVQGFECLDHEQMKELWPEGTTTAMEVGLAGSL